MQSYICVVCDYVYDEAEEEILWEELAESWVCPICTSEQIYFEEVESEEADSAAEEAEDSSKQGPPQEQKSNLDYSSSFYRQDDKQEKQMDNIHQVAVSGTSINEAMRSSIAEPFWEDILIMGAQLSRLPLNKEEAVSTTTTIGAQAAQPMVIENPVLISHMSFGALSKEMKIALAKGAAQSKTAIGGGEGGVLAEEKEAAYKYIFEYVPNLYSVSQKNLKEAAAIEIKIGQGTKAGMGGHLPAEKVTPEIAEIRDKPLGEDIISPARFADINSKEDLKELVTKLRELSAGRPIGVKIAAGHIEADLECIAYAEPDFVTIDGRGGATGSTLKVVKDATSVPTVFALDRARKYLDEQGLDIDLIITGGLRMASDFAKALALGADAIAIATSALMAAACQQYRVCDRGRCPVGAATQDEELRERLNVENSAQRLANFLQVSLEELKTFARLAGHADLHALSLVDLYTVNSEIASHTRIPHV
ncbi:glutamate synthase-related protein [Fuchsiella alkaliacetigena]|uniref:glutamate synthase-related protein n=1 Tax=Fuchsiella alkaliacetigena TaxID=957042 RepID=UPI00200AEBBC|nr:glutamate synthase-related protein [Fuchsiella alkaliacetigena]MCK8825734.1 glutamate synthase-related protein [Fuchsiella alkaliacetigena]